MIGLLLPPIEKPRRVGGQIVDPPPVPNRKPWPFVGTLFFRGIKILVENLPGSVRKWPGGSTKMRAIYGEIENTVGIDGEPVDVYVGPENASELVVVVHQPLDGVPGTYDEDKVMLGFATADDAVACFRQHRNDLDGVPVATTELTLGELSDRIYGGWWSGSDTRAGELAYGGIAILKSQDEPAEHDPDLDEDHRTGNQQTEEPEEPEEPEPPEYREEKEPVVKADGGPPGGGWMLIPGGKHGGYRRGPPGHYEYWYHGQVAHDAHPHFEPDPTRGAKDMKPGDLVDVGGRGGLHRWTPEHDKSPELMTWVTSMETGEHELVRRSTLQPVRPKVAKPKRPAPPPPPVRAEGGKVRPPPPPPPVRPGPQVDEPGASAQRLKPFKDSQAAAGTVLHDLEHGGLAVARFKSGPSDRYRMGVHLPRERQAAFMREFRPLVEGAAKKIGRRYKIATFDSHGPTAAYEELVAAATAGLALSLTSYQGGSPFLLHAQRYATTYAMAQARTELGAGVAIPDRTMRMLGGFMAATHRASIRHGVEHPTPEHVAETWAVRKRDAYTGELGHFERDGKTVDQGDEPLPDGEWRIKGPDGREHGDPMPGKHKLAASLAQVVAAGKVEDSDWMLRHDTPALPDRMGDLVPVGSALHLRDDLNEVLKRLPDTQRRALEMHFGLHSEDGTPASHTEIADALELSPGSAEQSKRRAVKLLLERATEAAKRIADEKKSSVRAWMEKWAATKEPMAKPEGQSHRELAERFGGSHERVGLFTANARAGFGADAARVLEAEAQGKATPSESREVRDRAMAQRDRERLDAFRRHGATRTVDATDPIRADDDSSETGYMTALAKRGLRG